MMQKIMMNLTLETCGNGFVLCNCDKTSFFFFLAKSVLSSSLCYYKAKYVSNNI